MLCTAVDVTEKRLFEVRLASMAAQLATASHRFELALENSGITVFEQDADLRYTYVYNPPPGTRPEDFLGRTDAEIFPEHELRQDRARQAARARLRAAARRSRSSSSSAAILRFFILTLEAVATARTAAWSASSAARST